MLKTKAARLRTSAGAPIQLKADATTPGRIAGYASIFGNTDAYGEVVMPGAFADSLAVHKRKGTRPKMFWQHRPDAPIGSWLDISEDGKGLYVDGQLNLEVGQAREAHALLKAGDIDGLSIGYYEVVVTDDADKNVRRLVQLDLVEASVVSLAANDRAYVEQVKSERRWDRFEDFCQALREGKPLPAKDFEDLLRDAGVPKSMATKIASTGYAAAIRSDSEGEEATKEGLRAVADAVRAFR